MILFIKIEFGNIYIFYTIFKNEYTGEYCIDSKGGDRKYTYLKNITSCSSFVSSCAKMNKKGFSVETIGSVSAFTASTLPRF